MIFETRILFFSTDDTLHISSHIVHEFRRPGMNFYSALAFLLSPMPVCHHHRFPFPSTSFLSYFLNLLLLTFFLSFLKPEWIESRSFIFLPCRNTTWQDMKHMLSRFTKSQRRPNVHTMLYTRILLWYEWHLRRLTSPILTTKPIETKKDAALSCLTSHGPLPQRSRIWWFGDVVEQRHCSWLEWNFDFLLFNAEVTAHSEFFYSWIFYTYIDENTSFDLHTESQTTADARLVEWIWLGCGTILESPDIDHLPSSLRVGADHLRTFLVKRGAWHIHHPQEQLPILGKQELVMDLMDWALFCTTCK